MTISVATRTGILICDTDNTRWQVVRRGLEGQHVTSVIAREGVILAGTMDGIFCSEDLGQSWFEASQGLHQRHVRWMSYHPDISDFELAGTEPAGVFVSRNGGENWQGCPEVEALRDQHDWFLPYSPEAGCVRGFAHHGDRVYGAVEVGGLLRSENGGEQWRLVGGSSGNPAMGQPASGRLHADVHSVYVHPHSKDDVLAATGGGLFRSQNGGESWAHLYRCYCRAAWWDPADPDHIVFGPAHSVDRGGRIEESHDGGQSWEVIGDGLDAPWPRHMVERLTPVQDGVAAVLSNGELRLALPDDWQWETPLPDVQNVDAVTQMGEAA
jgi:photosystem II stability/assembly factor-like uncharacterized protein